MFIKTLFTKLLGTITLINHVFQVDELNYFLKTDGMSKYQSTGSRKKLSGTYIYEKIPK